MAEPRPTEKLMGSDALPYFYGKKWMFFREGLQKGLHFPNFRGGVSDRKLRGHRLQVAVFEVLEG